MEEKEQEKHKSNKILDSSINFIFSNNPLKWLLLITILGAFLRFLMARNVSALGDEMVHGPHAIGFLHSGLISTIAHSPLWFYLTDIFFKILGVTMFSTRFLSFFYGTLSILVIYLIASKIFSRKIALISSFLISISYFTIRYTLAEMDISAIFFLLMAIYFFIDSSEKNKFPYLAAICIGIASLIKTLSLFFVPAFLIAFFLFRKNEEKMNKKEFIGISKKVIYFGILVLLIFSPILINNYLWYKDKGMVDTYFAQYFNIGKAREAYSGQLGYDSGFLFKRFFEGTVKMSIHLFKNDPIIFILGILGIITSFFILEKKYWIFLTSFQLFGFFFLILTNWLPTHYTTMMPVLTLFGGFFIDNIINKFQNINYKKTLFIFLALIFIFQIYLLLPHLTSRCGICQMRDYAEENMDKNSIVIADARIYRGRIAWLFYDFHYLESSFFPEIMSVNQNLSGQQYPLKVYFVECVKDDCGWGTVREGPLNQSSEELIRIFSDVSTPIKTIYGGGGYEDDSGMPYMNIYSATININPQIIGLIDSTHDWFYYPVNYIPKEKIFEQYSVYGFLDNLMYLFAWLIIIISIVLALAFPIKLVSDLINT